MGDKTVRQLSIYNNICSTHFHGPSDLMHRFNISRRTLQRDLKDLKDSGMFIRDFTLACRIICKQH